MHRVRSQELIREAGKYRLGQQVGRPEPAPRAMAACTLRQAPRRLPAWLRE